MYIIIITHHKKVFTIKLPLSSTSAHLQMRCSTNVHIIMITCSLRGVQVRTVIKIWFQFQQISSIMWVQTALKYNHTVITVYINLSALNGGSYSQGEALVLEEVGGDGLPSSLQPAYPFWGGWGEEMGRYVLEQCRTLKIIKQTAFRCYTDPSCLPRFWCRRRHSWCARTRCLRTRTTCRAHWCWCRRRGSCLPASVCAQPANQTPLSPPSCWPVLSSWAFLKQVKATPFFCAWTSD